MRPTLLSTCLFLAAVPLAAQAPSASVAPAVKVPDSILASTCRVGMSARQDVWDHTIRVGNAQKVDPGPGQRIALTLIDSQSRQIVSATVKVLGLTGKDRILNASVAGHSSTPDASRILHLTRFLAAEKGVTADLSVRGFTSVTSIELLQVAFSDGTAWTTPATGVCRVAPDPMMLVALPD